MPKLLAFLALGALLSLPAAQAVALGFGRINNATVLGQPLSFTVGLRLDGDESVSADCVSAEVFSGENRLPPATLRVSIEPGADPAERTLRISSSAVIDEPVVSVNLQLACPNRLARKFIAFVDPPVIVLAQSGADTSASLVSPSRPELQTPPGATVSPATRAGPAAATKPPAKPAPRVRRQAPPVAAGTRVAGGPARGNERSAREARPAVKTARAAAPAAGSRLKLEAAEDDAVRDRLNLHLTSTLASQPAPAASAAERPPAIDSEAAARRAREQLLAMEGSLARLQAESRATQASLAQLQGRLREAEQQRYANPIVAGLAVLAAALAAALGWLVWGRSGDRSAGGLWWAPPAGATVAAVAVEAGRDAAEAGVPERDPRRLLVDEPPVAVTTASPMLLTQVHSLAQVEADELSRAAQPSREMSVEELIDLEQQAEFFSVLGQDEAAIDLLMSHLRSSGGASPLPYLKLLELYRRRNEREAYERIRERFNRRFNAYAPDWQADPQAGRTLLDYASVVARLESLWATPAQAMQTLEASLFRRDAGSSTFDLPAYRELLFLYSVARDLSERDAPRAGVDLLLPLDGEASDDARPLTLLHPTPPVAVTLEHPTVVDVDITCLDAGPAEGSDRPSRFHTDFSPTSGFSGLSGATAAARPA